MTEVKEKSYWELIEGMTAYLRANYRCFNLDSLAGKAGISTSLLSRIINGERNMTIKTFDKLLITLDSLGIDFGEYIPQ